VTARLCSYNSGCVIISHMRGWPMRSTKRSKRRRGHGSVRKHDVRRKHMLKVVRESANEGQVATSYSRLAYDSTLVFT
jgi:hypothetical protein